VSRVTFEGWEFNDEVSSSRGKEVHVRLREVASPAITAVTTAPAASASTTAEPELTSTNKAAL
jgi:hypothetical protein